MSSSDYHGKRKGSESPEQDVFKIPKYTPAQTIQHQPPMNTLGAHERPASRNHAENLAQSRNKLPLKQPTLAPERYPRGSAIYQPTTQPTPARAVPGQLLQSKPQQHGSLTMRTTSTKHAVSTGGISSLSSNLPASNNTLSRIQTQMLHTNTVVIIITHGRSYVVQKDVVCKASAYFDRTMHGDSADTQCGIIRMRNDTRATMDVFVAWLEDHNILEPPRDDPMEEPPSFLDLVRLYVFASYREVEDMKPSIVRATIRRLARSEGDLGSDANLIEGMSCLWKRTERYNVLQQIVVEWMTHCAGRTSSNLAVITDKLPRECIQDVMAKLAEHSTPTSGALWLTLAEGSHTAYLKDPSS